MADQETINFYEQSAEERAARFEAADVAPLHAAALEDCPAGGTVLDVGCGSGRDVAWLVAQGRDARGVDATAGMLAQARALHPECAERFSLGALPALAGLGEATFDLVTCQAVLMHLPEDQLGAALARLRSLVAPGGALHLSIPELPSDAEGDVDDTEGGRRLFNRYDPARVRAELEGLGLTCAADLTDPDGLGRTRRHWRVLRFRAAAAG